MKEVIYHLDKQLFTEDKEAAIKTDIGEVVLRLEEKSGMLKKRILVMDRYYVEIGRIQKRSFLKGGQYEIYYDEQIIGTISQKRIFFSKRTILKTSDDQIFRISGSIKSFTYDILFKRKSVAKIAPDLAHRPTQYGMLTKGEKKHRYAFLCTAVILSLK